MTAVTSLLHAFVQVCILLLSSDQAGCRKVLYFGMRLAVMTVEWGWQCLRTMLMLSGLMQSAVRLLHALKMTCCPQMHTAGLLGQTLATALWHVSMESH